MVLKKPASKEVTKPEGFHLEIEKRLQERQASKKPEEEEDYTFHPRPLPTRILEEIVVSNRSLNPFLSLFYQGCDVLFIIPFFFFFFSIKGVPEKKVLNPTVPESPAFALKNRVRIEKKKEVHF